VGRLPDGRWPGKSLRIIPSGGAGGTFKIAGDYLFRTHQSFTFDKGVWGILRVQPLQKKILGPITDGVNDADPDPDPPLVP